MSFANVTYRLQCYIASYSANIAVQIYEGHMRCDQGYLLATSVDLLSFGNTRQLSFRHLKTDLM